MQRYLLYLPVFIIFVCSAPAPALENYYGPDLARMESDLGSVNLKQKLFEVLKSVHVLAPGRPDQLVAACPEGQMCIAHKGLGYREARRKLFGSLFLTRVRNEYALPDIYCGRLMAESDFPAKQGPGPDKIPATTVVNAEHSWPQSRFSERFPEYLQKGDLHILFPASARSNSLRGNHPFGDVVTVRAQSCPASALGWIARGGNQSHFLPPPDYRGNVARAVLYFSVRYQMPITENEEESLRRWSDNDPVDEAERARHNQIFALQQVRNPFVDHPEWVDLISDF